MLRYEAAAVARDENVDRSRRASPAPKEVSMDRTRRLSDAVRSVNDAVVASLAVLGLVGVLLALREKARRAFGG